mmetsp:Transcript_21061/g.27142  ORF Transcript_21061/g.27142 Transcript_21061/m.27142 type:complete len:94 (+) Transcript_21061:1610-1891(+)
MHKVPVHAILSLLLTFTRSVKDINFWYFADRAKGFQSDKKHDFFRHIQEKGVSEKGNHVSRLPIIELGDLSYNLYVFRTPRFVFCSSKDQSEP